MEPARVRGYTALALMLVTWVVQSEIVQSIEEKANRPFLITFLNHASMALLVPFLPSGAFAALVATAGASKRRVAAVAAALSIVYTAGDYLWYVALPYTSVAEATVLFQAQSVFAVFLAAVLLRERPTVARVLGIAVSLGGVSLVACDGSSAAGGRRFLGDMLVVGGAASYAAYEVCFARWLGDAAGPVVNAATALVGVASLATTWPLFFVLDAAGLEPYAAPVPRDLWPWIALNAALALVFNASIMVAVVALSPVTASCATMLTIPLSALCDRALKGSRLAPAAWGGAALVVAGFLATELPSARREKGDDDAARPHYDAIAPEVV